MLFTFVTHYHLPLLVTPPSIFAGMVPVSLWGVGTRDGALAYFLQGITAPEIAISAGFLLHSTRLLVLGVIGTPFSFVCKEESERTTTIQD